MKIYKDYLKHPHIFSSYTPYQIYYMLGWVEDYVNDIYLQTNIEQSEKIVFYYARNVNKKQLLYCDFDETNKWTIIFNTMPYSKN